MVHSDTSQRYGNKHINQEESSDSDSELFFSESFNSVDKLLEEQDIIIDSLRKELKELKKNVKDDVVKCLRTLNILIEKVIK